MFRRLSVALPSLFVGVLAATVTPWSWGQGHVRGLVSEGELGRYGLTRAWVTQATVDSSRGSLSYCFQYLSPQHSRVTYEVRFPGGLEVFTDSDPGRDGALLGREGAKRKAELSAELLRARLKRLRLDPALPPDARQTQESEIDRSVEVKEVVTPRITLFLATSRGTVDAIDAETGQRYWSAQIGNPEYPTLAPAADDAQVAVVNGSTLYLLDANDGQIRWSGRTKGVPGAGAALNERQIFLPMVDGTVEVYSATDPTQPVSYNRGIGHAMIQPVMTPRSVAWPTDRGFLYVAPARGQGIRYRLEANKTMVATPSHQGRRLFAPSIDGFVYCVDEINGRVEWTYSTGEPISQTPVVVGNAVYVCSDEGRLHAVSADMGKLEWSSEGILQLLAVGAKRLYCVGTQEQMVALDRQSGAWLASGRQRLPSLRVTNVETDRIFVASGSGALQCLREVAATYPTLNIDLAEQQRAARPPSRKKPATGTETAPEAGEERDPFGTAPPAAAPAPGDERDPFGGGAPQGGAEPPGGERDPFGGAAPPENRPGGEDDPFGAPPP